ncbi:dihydrolipoamide acetyltransferase family protein [Neobacillus kokaensis]|uniref:Dihydrolipoamide acetyltransferase component of pyruvate dehydrogenase complex n=1 Tax=Neobacillus kokaensis TaxID=2759023 RepID=A0ABQ3N4B9_9BACI|nr:dihydrolipoamide acetyltransferase family protein [Neobacillus kokaensis]GHH98931.1 dihydrolipoamide acetyltransferase component of pyruvate dehydrogenase complex [Neobacillus kokaensis]
MATEVVMPKLGATMEEGTIVSWLAQVGEVVEEGDAIAEVQTDKIVLEVEAETTGVLLKTLYDEGSTVKVQEVIAYLGEEGESVDGIDHKSFSASQAAAAEDSAIQERPFENPNKKRRTPAARKLAEANHIDLRRISGSGPKGRIQKNDVENYLVENTKKITPLAEKIAVDLGIDYKNVTGTGSNGKIVKADLLTSNPTNESHVQPAIQQGEKRVPFKGIRKVIADRMVQSANTAPHVTLTSEVDMTNCVRLRKELLPVIEKISGCRLSFNEIIFKATAHTLQRHPDINVSLDKNEIVYHTNVNVGMAVAVPNGLVVPVVKNANQMGLAALTEECKALGKRAREGKLLPEQMQNGTFTISNLGMYAVDGFTPIINQPESAILGVGTIKEKPVVINGEISIRSMMVLSLSFDHRIIDGAPAAAFITDLKETLENPFKLIV